VYKSKRNPPKKDNKSGRN